MNNTNFTQRRWFVLLAVSASHLYEKEGSCLAQNEMFVIAATVERNHTISAMRRKMGKPVVLLGTSRLLVFCG
jgi:hypothetical protein